QIKQGIPIHPAGEWILDNLYVIEEIVKSISRELTLKKYTEFLGLANGTYKGFARVYVLATEMVAYTDGKINSENLETMLQAYQTKKTLSMNEIWSIGLFIQIALVENIREICETIYLSQLQKHKVENILSKFFDTDKKTNRVLPIRKIDLIKTNQIKNTFVEYMSYKLKKYGSQAYAYLTILEEEVAKTGNDISDIIKKEHFDIAVKKVSVGNCIMTIKNMSRINFLEVFERINRVEDILKQDPAQQYDKMDGDTKTYYRNAIQEISKKTKVSEIYIAKKCLELSEKAAKKNNDNLEGKCENLDTGIARENQQANMCKKSHIGYYLISEGKEELLNNLIDKKIKLKTNEAKAKYYIQAIWGSSIIISLAFCTNLFLAFSKININLITNIIFSVLLFFILIIPVENIVTKIIQYILSKIVKPKLIPKLDFQHGIPKEYSTMVVIPTIVKSGDKVKELMKKLEVYYIANKSENLYFTLLGDCSSGDKEIENFDEEVINAGIEEVKRLNNKYKSNKFNFVYRKRIWNPNEECYMGWERKRGLLNQFNEFLLGNIENPFRINTIENIEKIKYIITLDSDTELSLNSGLELVGAMAHILNKPILNKNEDLVISGHALMQPRVGIGLLDSRRSIFTQIYAGEGGTDSYTNAISDIYQDNFEEGIFTGKGIYDLQIFSNVLNDEIKENTVLSHDLLEGSYLRCGMASDIMLMDGYPSNYMSFRTRLYRWIRGDYQILPWLKKTIENKKGKIKNNPLNLLSKYKIFSNIVRSKQETAVFALLLYSWIVSCILKVNLCYLVAIGILSIVTPTVLDIINAIVSKKEGNIKTKRFVKTIDGLKASILRAIIDVMLIPDKMYISVKAECKTIYRMVKSKKHLLEWITSEEAEKTAKSDIVSYYKNMAFSAIIGIIGIASICIGIKSLPYGKTNMSSQIITILALSVMWLIIPAIMCKISKKNEEKKAIEELSPEDKKYVLEIGYKTWLYFKENLNSQSNFLPPDNYQEDRKPQVVMRTSSTNIGLALLAVVSSYDLGYESFEDTIELLYKMINTICNLTKWNGHLYNWYNIETLEPLIPRYISSVDSGNFIGYLFVLKQFLESQRESNLKEKIEIMLDNITNIIENTDFTKLYDEENRLFSVGFNVEDNKLTDSYYDLLASEARQTSLIAIAKKDISEKHWYNLSRTLTTLDNYKGLISWSGTSFEYLMPTVNIAQYPGSILDESCKFMIMSQLEYSKKLGIPWGISEAAFNLKDLNNNYQYKAFGIPWLGLKRGLSDEIVVSSYGCILAITEAPKLVLENLKKLESKNMYSKYGFYESIDFTPGRTKNGYTAVKTYMAHHQGLILLSINNLMKDNILQKRFMENPEIKAVDILLQEKMPENMITTKEEKEKIEKIKYQDYEDYTQRQYTKINENLNISNVIANDNYTIVMDQYGDGYSKYKDIQVNRYKETDEAQQGIMFYIKNIRNKNIWTNNYSKNAKRPDKYNIIFAPEMNKIVRVDENIETITKTIVDTDEPVEIRRLELKNNGTIDEILEVTGYIEQILSEKMQDFAHKAFNNLFISYEYIDAINTILIKRKAHTKEEKDIYLAVNLYTQANILGELEYEIDKEKFTGRCNYGLPREVVNSNPFSKKIGYTTDPIVALKNTISIKPEETAYIDLIISVGEQKDEVLKNIVKFMNNENTKRTFELLKAKSEAENRYLGIKGKDIEIYQKMLSYLLFSPKVSIKKNNNMQYPISELWKYGISGDLPILLIKIKDINDIDIIKEALSAYE
ncbi:MAG: glucoamylase family protein, partial [Clostridia bacterium]